MQSPQPRGSAPRPLRWHRHVAHPRNHVPVGRNAAAVPRAWARRRDPSTRARRRGPGAGGHEVDHPHGASGVSHSVRGRACAAVPAAGTRAHRRRARAATPRLGAFAAGLRSRPGSRSGACTPVDGAFAADQGGGVQVPDERVVLDPRHALPKVSAAPCSAGSRPGCETVDERLRRVGDQGARRRPRRVGQQRSDEQPQQHSDATRSRGRPARWYAEPVKNPMPAPRRRRPGRSTTAPRRRPSTPTRMSPARARALPSAIRVEPVPRARNRPDGVPPERPVHLVTEVERTYTSTTLDPPS